jgi:hypothetical protein
VCDTVEIDGGWLKTREGAIDSAEQSLAILLGDALTELGLDGRSYDDGTAVTFERKVPANGRRSWRAAASASTTAAAIS